MIPLPWVSMQPVDPDRDYVAMASRLPLRRHRSIPGFLRDTLRIRRQLAHTDGLVGYALSAELARKTFWTFSVWADRASLDAFAAADPHRVLIGRLRPHLRESRFEFFVIRGDEMPMSRAEMMARVR